MIIFLLVMMFSLKPGLGDSQPVGSHSSPSRSQGPCQHHSFAEECGENGHL